MKTAKKLSFAAALFCGFAVAAAPMLPEGKAPFKNETGGKAYTGDAVLDQKKTDLELRQQTVEDQSGRNFCGLVERSPSCPNLFLHCHAL